MCSDFFKARVLKGRNSAFTLPEVVLAVAITAVAFGGIIMAYSQATRRAQWSGYSLSAQALAVQQIEQARASVWDLSVFPIKNDLTNLTLMGKTFSGNI